MPLTDNGKEVLQDAYMEFIGNLDGLLGELDRLTTSDEGEDFDIMEDVMDLIADSVDDFTVDISDIYDTEWLEEEELDEDVDFEAEIE
jgi:hypothetical protein